ncbi:MAG: formylglycine-generating enzyme family protein, partial [Nitrospinota bacterium]
FENSKPEKELFLPGFYIDKYEVTNQQYFEFVKQTRHPAPSNWKGGRLAEGKETHPVETVTWYDADAYCTWAGGRLPTEAEWEKAARGPDGNKYPWGNVFDEKAGNLSQKKTASVGSMPGDVSFYGVYDFGGNVSEWTSSWYKAYAGSTFQSPKLGETHRVARGGYGSISGHYNLGMVYAQSSHRKTYPPAGKGVTVGFRCARNP